jgi:hypothetical protein
MLLHEIESHIQLERFRDWSALLLVGRILFSIDQVMLFLKGIVRFVSQQNM